MINCQETWDQRVTVWDHKVYPLVLTTPWDVPVCTAPDQLHKASDPFRQVRVDTAKGTLDCACRESNTGPLDRESSALPLSYTRG